MTNDDDDERRARERRARTRRMFAWEDQIAADPAAKRQAAALRIVAILRQEVGRRVAGAAEIDQRWLAAQANVSRRGCQKALAWLCGRRHLRVECRKHLREHNRYWPLVGDAERRDRLVEETRELLRVPRLGRPLFGKSTGVRCEPPMRTGVRIGDVRSEPQYRDDANGRAENVRTAVRTSKTVEPSKSSFPAGRRDRGAYEVRLARRLGDDGWDVLARLPEAELGELCEREASEQVSDEELGQLRLRLFRVEPGADDRPAAANVASAPTAVEATATDDSGRQMLLLQQWGAEPQEARACVERWHGKVPSATIAAAFEGAARRGCSNRDRRRWVSEQMERALRNPHYRVPCRAPHATDGKAFADIERIFRSAHGRVMTVDDVAAALPGKTRATVVGVLSRMFRAGRLDRVEGARGRYALPAAAEGANR